MKQFIITICSWETGETKELGALAPDAVTARDLAEQYIKDNLPFYWSVYNVTEK